MRRRRSVPDTYLLQFGGPRIARALAARMAERVVAPEGEQVYRVPVSLADAIEAWLRRQPPRQRVELACQYGIVPPPDEWANS